MAAPEVFTSAKPRAPMRRTVAILAFLLSATSGCGTVANLRGQTVVSIGGPFPCPTRPFGGVIQDATTVAEIPCGFMLLPDLPFSLVGDIVSLPWTTYVYLRQQADPATTDEPRETTSP
jgi:hypothetical protein